MIKSKFSFNKWISGLIYIKKCPDDIIAHLNKFAEVEPLPKIFFKRVIHHVH